METSQFWGSGYLSYPFIFIFFLIFIDLLNGDLTKKGFKLKRILTFFLH